MTESFGVESVVIPDLPEPITAYRAWMWDGRSLVGMFGAEWPADAPMEAECIATMNADDCTLALKSCGSTPSPTNANHIGYGCGIYGFRSLAQLARCGQIHPVCVWGEVELGGTVYEHEHGYRASHASVKAIYRTLNRDRAEGVAAAYGVPCLDPEWDGESAAALDDRLRVPAGDMSPPAEGEPLSPKRELVGVLAGLGLWVGVIVAAIVGSRAFGPLYVCAVVVTWGPDVSRRISRRLARRKERRG